MKLKKLILGALLFSTAKNAFCQEQKTKQWSKPVAVSSMIACMSVCSFILLSVYDSKCSCNKNLNAECLKAALLWKTAFSIIFGSMTTYVALAEPTKKQTT
jgi:hypothetical protein